MSRDCDCPFSLAYQSALAELFLYHSVDLSANDADACIARLAVALHLADLVKTLELCAYPHSHGASFEVTLHSMRALLGLLYLYSTSNYFLRQM